MEPRAGDGSGRARHNRFLYLSPYFDRGNHPLLHIVEDTILESLPLSSLAPMPVDFKLGPSEAGVHAAAAGFA